MITHYYVQNTLLAPFHFFKRRTLHVKILLDNAFVFLEKRGALNRSWRPVSSRNLSCYLSRINIFGEWFQLAKIYIWIWKFILKPNLNVNRRDTSSLESWTQTNPFCVDSCLILYPLSSLFVSKCAVLKGRVCYWSKTDGTRAETDNFFGARIGPHFNLDFRFGAKFFRNEVSQLGPIHAFDHALGQGQLKVKGFVELRPFGCPRRFHNAAPLNVNPDYRFAQFGQSLKNVNFGHLNDQIVKVFVYFLKVPWLCKFRPARYAHKPLHIATLKVLLGVFFAFPDLDLFVELPVNTSRKLDQFLANHR